MGIIYSKSEGEKVNNKCKSAINSVNEEIGKQNLNISTALAFFNTCNGKGIESSKKYLRLYMDNNIRYNMTLNKLASSINEIHSDFNAISSESKVDVPKWEKVIEKLKTIIKKNDKSIEELDSKELVSNVVVTTVLEAQNHAFENMKTEREYWIEEAKNSDSKKISVIKSIAFDFMFIEDNFKNLADVVDEDGSIKKNSRDYFTKIESNNNYFAAKEEYELSDDDIVNLSNSGVMPKDIAEGYSAAETDADKKMLGGFLKRDFDKAFDVNPNKMSEGMKNYRNKFITNYINNNKDRVSEFDGKEVKGGEALNLINGLSKTSDNEVSYDKSSECMNLIDYLASYYENNNVTNDDSIWPAIILENVVTTAIFSTYDHNCENSYIDEYKNKHDYSNIGKGISIDFIEISDKYGQYLVPKHKDKNASKYDYNSKIEMKFSHEYVETSDSNHSQDMCRKKSEDDKTTILISNPGDKTTALDLHILKDKMESNGKIEKIEGELEKKDMETVLNLIFSAINTPYTSECLKQIKESRDAKKENYEKLKKEEKENENIDREAEAAEKNNGYTYYNTYAKKLYASGIIINNK